MKRMKCRRSVVWLLVFSLFLGGCSMAENRKLLEEKTKQVKEDIQKEIEKGIQELQSGELLENLTKSDSGKPYKVLNENKPDFSEKQKKLKKAFEKYSSLDSLGRCGVAFANICTKIMPKEKRGKIGSVKPSGWQTVKYKIVDGRYLYNRCHLIGYQLAGENANEKNLITGTRYMNTEGMLPFENQVAEYVKTTDHHVLYRVTPVFEGKNLLASGVQMEAYSVEDQGKGVCFNVFVYNIQPGVEINYANGKSRLIDAKAASGKKTGSKKKKSGKNTSSAKQGKESASEKKQTYILNKNTKKFHLPDCSSVKETEEKYKKQYKGYRSKLISRGYIPCKKCNP